MMAKKETICCLCNESIKGQVYKKGRKVYCEHCIEKEDIDWFDWCNLYEYIKKLYNVDKVSVRIMTQLHRYKKENKLTDYGILNTLIYVHEINTNIKIDTEMDTVGIIPYYYDEASKYFQNKERISEQAEYVNDNEKEINITSRVSFKIENNQKELDIGGEWEE